MLLQPPLRPIPDLPEGALRLQGPRPTFVVAFGGLREGFGWDRRLAAMGYPALCFRDSRERWYLDGCDGASWPELVQLVRAVRPPGARLAVLGQSAGGFAALRLACALGAEAACAFAPQTHFHRSPRDDVQAAEPPRDLPDLRETVRCRPARTRIHLVVSRCEDGHRHEYFWDDHAHVRRLADLPGVHVHMLPHDRHTAAHRIAAQGDMPAALEFMLEGRGAWRPRQDSNAPLEDA